MTFKKAPQRRNKDLPSLHLVKQYSKLLDDESKQYLRKRGVNEEVMQRFQIGKRKGKMITIPNIATINGKARAYGIKYRWLPQHQPEGYAKYFLEPGSVAKSIYNFDVLKRHWTAVIIVESVMDVLVLSSLGLPAVASFGGGNVWGEDWGQYFDCDVILNIGDRDEAKDDGNGGVWYPGREYAARRAMLLGMQVDAKYSKVITVEPPENFSDVGEAVEQGFNVKDWAIDMVKASN